MTPSASSTAIEPSATKVALVLGGTRGIGGAISRRLHADGASLAISYLSRDSEAATIAADLAASGLAPMMVKADIADPVALADAIDQVVARFGRIDILICSAGLTITGPLAAYPPDSFDRVFAINVRAPFLAAQQAARAMPDGGRIIMIGSIVAARAPGAGVTLYAASKSALVGMVRGMARDLGSRGITVNLIQPGPIDTERNPAHGPNAEANRLPLAIARHGTVDEVAGLAAYLSSDAAGFVTGAVHDIDGGWSA